MIPLAAVAAALAALGVRLVRARRRSSGPPTPPPTVPGGDPADAPLAEEIATEEFACEQCGHRLRRHGEGRHTVYWEAGASSSDPLVDRTCPSCGHDLPHEHPQRAT